MSVTGSHTRSPVRMGTASANVACLAAGFGLGHSWPQQQHMVAWSGLISSHSGQVFACTLVGATAVLLLPPTVAGEAQNQAVSFAFGLAGAAADHLHVESGRQRRPQHGQ